MALEVTASALVGRRVLVVEDESLIAMLIEDALADMGCALAGTASKIEEALEKAKSLPFDIAILDVNLGGQPTFPVAEALIARGKPFVFATGYGASGIPSALQAIPIIHKPFDLRDLERVLRAALP